MVEAKTKMLTVRLNEGRSKDLDILYWLESIELGDRSAAVREALYRYAREQGFPGQGLESKNTKHPRLEKALSKEREVLVWKIPS